MSEKRKGHFDPRNLETYQSLQRVKGAKDGNKGMTRLCLQFHLDNTEQPRARFREGSQINSFLFLHENIS